jgi:O-acetyl-ADP-ribose deacetylase (regulator of RNase III)
MSLEDGGRMQVAVGKRTLELVCGDITKVQADAIGNAANAALAGGGGVDGAIHRSAGPSVMEECRRIGSCATGSAAPTRAGNLKASWIFHAVGPVWRGGGAGESGLLAGAYQACLDLSDLKRCRSLALPAISTGVYGYPMEAAADVALSTVLTHLGGRTQLDRVTFVLFDRAAYDTFGSVLSRLAGTPGTAPPA